MMASRWQAPSVLICTTGTPRASIRSASIEPAISPSMTAGRRPPAEMIEEGLQQRGLAAAGRAHHVDAEHARRVESAAVLGRQLIVGFEDVLGSDEFHGSLCPADLTRQSSISILCSSSSRPSSITISGLPHRGQSITISAISVGAPHWRQRETAGGSRIASSAPSAGVPGESRPKANRKESQCTPGKPSHGQFQPLHGPVLPGPVEFRADLFDQRFGNGQFVHEVIIHRLESRL